MSGRIVIYVKDVQRLTGKGERASREMLKKIREKKGKSSEQLISVLDFAEFSGLSVDLIMKHLVD